MDTTDIGEYVRYNPLFAAVTGKDEAARQSLLQRFDILPEDTKEMLTAPSTTAALKDLETRGVLPETHVVAVGKVLFLAALGDVPRTSIEALLEKLDLPPEHVAQINAVLMRLLVSLTAEKAKAAQPVMEKLPPMSRPSESGPRTLSPQQPPRNIIDLRKQQPNA